MTQPKIESLELTNLEPKLAFAILVSILLMMDLVFNLTAMLILSAHNANKGFNYASNVLHQKIESLNSLKVYVFAWMASTQMSIIIVFHVHLVV